MGDERMIRGKSLVKGKSLPRWAWTCLLIPLALNNAVAQEAPSPGSPAPLTIYSPAPPSNILYEQHAALGLLLDSCGIPNTVTAMSLPQSVNQFSELGAEAKSHDLPILTTVDFITAISGGGPELHAYVRPSSDLKFVASLGETAFGMLVFDESISVPEDLKGKRIAVPPRQSSVRVFTEALLEHGWQVRDQVELVEMPPPDLPAAIAEGWIDATTYVFMSRTNSGFVPSFPPLLAVEHAHWIDVDETAVSAINAAGGMRTESVILAPAAGTGESEGLSLLSFRQALTAWDSTPEETVSNILSCMEARGKETGFLDGNRLEMADWPGITDEMMHRGALNYFRRSTTGEPSTSRSP